MRGSIAFASEDPRGDAVRYVANLQRRLERDGVGPFEVDGLQIDVRAGLFRARPSTHPFRSVSSASFRAVPGDKRLVIEYDVGMTGLVALGTATSFIVAGIVWIRGESFATVVLVLAFFLGSGVGLNAICVAAAIRKFLRSVSGPGGRA